MSEKELGRALLHLDAGLYGLLDVKEMTRRVLERDRRRVWWLTALTVVLWVVALAMVLGVFIAFALLFPLQAKLMQEIERGKITAADRERAQFKSQVAGNMINLVMAGSVGVLGLAALGTVLLVVASRRATLRQVSASLLEISEQLKRLREGSAPGPGG
jgi:hypothetical protein